MYLRYDFIQYLKQAGRLPKPTIKDYIGEIARVNELEDEVKKLTENLQQNQNENNKEKQKLLQENQELQKLLDEVSNELRK